MASKHRKLYYISYFLTRKLILTCNVCSTKLILYNMSFQEVGDQFFTIDCLLSPIIYALPFIHIISFSEITPSFTVSLLDSMSSEF